MNIEKTCAFTGHRDIEEQIDMNFFEKCMQELIDRGFDTFLCGMARGFDLISGELVVKLKEKNPHIRLVACIPCPDQDKYYRPEDREKYNRVLKECDEVKILSEKFYKGCMLARDRYMVDNSSLLFGYERKREGGTHYTISYAHSKNKNIIMI